jgi:hypothetical protein
MPTDSSEEVSVLLLRWRQYTITDFQDIINVLFFIIIILNVLETDSVSVLR